MPLAKKNLFVALKQERFAGRDMDEVRRAFVQIVQGLIHLHKKGVLHGDIKVGTCVSTSNQVIYVAYILSFAYCSQ